MQKAADQFNFNINQQEFPTLYRWLEYDYEKPAGRSPGSIPLGSGLPVS